MLHTKYISSGRHGFREEDFLSFSHYKSMGLHDPLGRGLFGPRGLDWQDLCRRPLNIASYKVYKPWASLVSEKKIFFSYYKSKGYHEPLGRGQFGPQGLDWQDLCRRSLNIASYKVYKPWASLILEKKIFLSFSHYKSKGAISRHGGHLDLRTITIFTNFQSPFNTRIHIKFEEI